MTRNFFGKKCMNLIKEFVPKIDNDFREGCEEELTYEELDNTVKCLKADYSLGPDGLTAMFQDPFGAVLKILKDILKISL